MFDFLTTEEMRMYGQVKGNWNDNRRSVYVAANSLASVIIIHATQHYLCFLQFHISDAYLKDFESRAPRSFISVHATPWYDLATQSGRLGVLHNLTKLVALAVNF